MASVRATSTACVSDATGAPGALAWFTSTDPTGTTPLVGTETNANDGLEAAVQLSQNSITAWCRASGFDFSAIPDNATIVGRKVYVRRRYDNTTGVAAASTQVKMSQEGASVGSDLGAAGAWPLTETETTYGNEADLGGVSWTPAQVKDSDSGACVAITAVATMGTAVTLNHFIEQIEIEWFYEEATGARQLVNDGLANNSQLLGALTG